jgi:hypothetical protein
LICSQDSQFRLHLKRTDLSLFWGYHSIMPGQGSTGNVIAAVCSFFIPGLGQLVQGRILMALFQFVVGVVIWLVSFGYLGWVVHLWSVIDAALWKGPKSAR